MGLRIPINFFSRPSDSSQSDRHYYYEKQSRIFDFVDDGSGVIDLYTDDSINNIPTTSKKNTRALWITESVAYRQAIFQILISNISLFFEKYNLDYIFTYESQLSELDKRIILMKGCGHWIKYPSLYRKYKTCSMITSLKQITELQKFRVKVSNSVPSFVDVFGESRIPLRFKESALCPYMFSIVIENNVTDSYFTEKIVDCFATGTVPLYIGARNISHYFDVNGIIPFSHDFDFSLLTPDLYVSMMPAIKNNLRLSMQYEMPLESCLLHVINNNHLFFHDALPII